MKIPCPECRRVIEVPKPAIRLRCGCGTSILVPGNVAGEQVQCVNCETYLNVPVSQEIVSNADEQEPAREEYVQPVPAANESRGLKVPTILTVVVVIGVIFTLMRCEKQTSRVPPKAASPEQAGDSETNKRAMMVRTEAEEGLPSNITDITASVPTMSNEQETASLAQSNAGPQSVSRFITSEFIGKSGGVTVSSKNLRGIQAEFNGKYAFGDDVIKISIDDASVRFPKISNRIDSICIALGRNDSQNKWVEAGRSELWRPESAVKLATEFHLKELEFAVPITNTIDFNRHWLAVWLKCSGQNNLEICFGAMSGKDIFSRPSPPQPDTASAPEGKKPARSIYASRSGAGFSDGARPPPRLQEEAAQSETAKIESDRTATGSDLCLVKDWDTNIKSKTSVQTDLMRILHAFGEAKIDLGRSDDIVIFQDLTYLMDIKEAFNKLDERLAVPVQLVTPYFMNKSFQYYVISKNIVDNQEMFNRILLVADGKSQLVAVQLINQNPKEIRINSYTIKDGTIYNIVQNRCRPSLEAKVGYRVYFKGCAGSGSAAAGEEGTNKVLCIESELVAPENYRQASKEFVRLYLPAPIVNLLLYCLNASR